MDTNPPSSVPPNTNTGAPDTGTTSATPITPQTPRKSANTSTANNTPKGTKYSYASTINPVLIEKYECALLFHKNATQQGGLSYDAKVELVALAKQVTKGPCIEENEPAIGYFDWLGGDRREAWLALEDMSQQQAMERFCKNLNEFVPAFEPWYAARMEEKARKAQEERARLEKERVERERLERERKERLHQQELQRERLEQQRLQHLAQQQQQLFQQQQQQRQQQQQQSQQQSQQQERNLVTPSQLPQQTIKNMDAPSPSTPSVTKTVTIDVKEFRESLRGKPKHEMVISPGEIVRMQAKNLEPGSTVLKWKFCTEDHDLGFGLEYDLAKTSDDDGEGETVCILPTTRIMADSCVTVGKHSETKPGSWSILFDNSYSYFRSKTVFFVVSSQQL
eukprot:m.164884 g.164884  ORF g.164884 m.164884 type:complete len:394 (+) comp31359_c5_seq1:271-1452(+)